MIKGIPLAIATNTLVQGLGKVVSSGTTFLIIVLVGRALGETLYGEFAKVFALVELFYMGVDFGFNAIVVREAVKKKENEKALLANLLGLRMVWGGAISLLVIFIAAVLPYDPDTTLGFSPLVKFGIFLAAANIFSQGILTTANAAFQARLRYDQSVLAVLGGAFLKLLLIFLLTLYGAPFLLLILAIVAGEVLSAILALSLTFRLLGLFPPRLEYEKIRAIFYAAFPLGLTLLFNLIYFRSDTLVLSFFRSSAEVGNYALAFRFFEATLVVPIFFSNAVYPVFVKSASQSREKLKRLLRTSLAFLFFSSIIVLFLVFLLAPSIISIFFGAGFSDASQALRILILGVPFFYLSAIFMWILIVLEKQFILAPIYGVAAVLTLGANLIFIPMFGFVAAALVTVFSEGAILLVSIFLTVYFLSKKR